MRGEASGMSGRQKPDVPMRYTIKNSPSTKPARLMPSSTPPG